MLDFIFNTIVVITTALIVLLTYIWLRQRYAYWQRRNIPFIKPILPFGNLKDLILFRCSFGDFFQKLYEASKLSLQTAPVIGVFWFNTPALIIRHTKLIERILIKDFNMFLNRYEAADAVHDIWGSLTLPLAKYPIWRESRKRMSEFFVSGKLKQRMYPLMLEISLELEQYIWRNFELKNNKNETIIEVKELCALYTTDLTTLLTFSIKANSLMGNLKIRDAVVDMFKPNLKKALNFFLLFFLPNWAKWFRAKVFPDNYKKIILEMLTENLYKRNFDKNANTQNNAYKDDLIDLLLNFQAYAKRTQKYEFAQNTDFIASQVAIMLIAGFETSSSSIAFILYELAKQPIIQQRLRNELSKYFNKNNICRRTLSYEELQQLQYLKMVVAEGLRMYPVAAFINREFTPNLENSGYSLRPFVDFDLPKGMPAYISILGLQRDEKYWINPEHFNPERFHPERIKFIDPMAYIPFGAGPHACIGSRLGVIQVKLGLIHILKNFRVEICERTPNEIIFEPTSFMLQNKGGIELKFIKDTIDYNKT